MTPEATLWAETQRLPLVACPDGVDVGGKRIEVGGLLGTHHPNIIHTLDCTCDGTGEVRSDVYRAIERAITVPVVDFAGLGVVMYGSGRLLRPQPGVMACTSASHGYLSGTRADAAPCDQCGKPKREAPGTVPDPSEAGAVARAEERGRLGLVVSALWGYQPMTPALFEAREDLREMLADGDNDGALAATLEAVRALVAAR